MIRFAIATTLVLTALLGAAAPELAGAQSAGLIDRNPIPVDRNITDLLLCRANVSTAEAKLAKSLVRCDRRERKSALTGFDPSACRKKALRRRQAAAPINCRKPTTTTTDRYTCSGLSCSCTGDADCNDMFTHANCGDVSSCDTSGSEPVCSCLIKLD